MNLMWRNKQRPGKSNHFLQRAEFQKQKRQPISESSLQQHSLLGYFWLPALVISTSVWFCTQQRRVSSCRLPAACRQWRPFGPPSFALLFSAAPCPCLMTGGAHWVEHFRGCIGLREAGAAAVVLSWKTTEDGNFFLNGHLVASLTWRVFTVSSSVPCC